MASPVNIILLDIPTRPVVETDISKMVSSSRNQLLSLMYTKRFGDSVILPPNKSYKAILLQMASILRRYDCILHYINTDYHDLQYLQDITKISDYIIVSDTTPQIDQIFELLRVAKKVNPQIFVISGGRHSKFYNIELLESMLIDLPVCVEAEVFLKRAIPFILNRNYDGLLEEFTPEKMETISDKAILMDDIPTPSYDLLPGGLKNFHAYFVGMRGCSYQCPYCCSNAFWDHMVRFSPKRYAQECKNIIDLTSEAYNILQLADDCAPLQFEYVEELEKLFNLSPKLRLILEMRLGDCNDKQLHFLSKLRPVQVNIGIESLSSSVMEYIRPDQTFIFVKDRLSCLRQTIGSRVIIKGYFMIGLPGESLASVLETCKGIEELVGLGYLDFPSIRMFKPLPGTKIYNHASEYGIKILSSRWNDYERYSFPSVHETEHLSAEEIYIAYLLAVSCTSKIVANKMNILEHITKFIPSMQNIESYSKHMGKLI